MTLKQIEDEFIRQIRLCSGIGEQQQKRLLAMYWAAENEEQRLAAAEVSGGTHKVKRKTSRRK